MHSVFVSRHDLSRMLMVKNFLFWCLYRQFSSSSFYYLQVLLVLVPQLPVVVIVPTVGVPIALAAVVEVLALHMAMWTWHLKKVGY